MTLRVVAGSMRGRRLTAPPGTDTRPTSDRVRESLFSILGPLDGLAVLDLFAGSGALGIEALSRGVATAVFVDHAPAALSAIRANLTAVGVEAEVHGEDALVYLRNASGSGAAYDLVFLDPPYSEAEALGQRLALDPVLASGARVVTESAARSPMRLDLPLIDERRYGDTVIAIHQRT